MALVSARSDLPGVTMIMPGFNEEVTILGSVAGVLSMDYPNLEVIVVNDGSSDRTVEVLVDRYDMAMVRGEPLAGPIHCAPVRALYRSRLGALLGGRGPLG